MRIRNGHEFSTDAPVKESRFNRFKKAAREKYVPSILVGTALATTAFNLIAADAPEKQQSPQTPDASMAIDAPIPEPSMTSTTLTESGPTLRVAFPDVNTNFSVNTPESSQFDSFLQSVGSYMQNDPTAIVTFSINGSASDEDRSSSVNYDSNLGLPSASNERLARDYADTAYRQLSESVARSSDAKSFRVGDISSRESLLNQSDQQAIEKVAAKEGLSRYALLGAYNDKTIQLDGADALTLTTLIDDNRGATITTSIDRTVPIPVEQPAARIIDAPEYAFEQSETERPFKFIPVPFAVPLRWRRRKTADSSANNASTTSIQLTPVPSRQSVGEFSSGVASIPMTANYNHPVAIPTQSEMTTKKKTALFSSVKDRLPRSLKRRIDIEITEFYRKKSNREAGRMDRQSRRRTHLGNEKTGILGSFNNLRKDVARALSPRV